MEQRCSAFWYFDANFPPYEKAPKPKALVQTSLCTAYRPAGKPPKRRNRCPDFALCAFTVPFLRRGFAPRFSVLAQIPREPCSCMPIFICKLIMNLFVHFVNTFTQKNSKNSKNGSVPPGAHFEHAFLPACSRCWGKMRPLSTK